VFDCKGSKKFKALNIFQKIQVQKYKKYFRKMKDVLIFGCQKYDSSKIRKDTKQHIYLCGISLLLPMIICFW
jgi:hypothetical protein